MAEARPRPKRLTLVRVEWILFFAATIEIAKRLGLNQAQAEIRLRRACAEGHIHAMRERYHNLLDRPAPDLESRIAPSEWRNGEPDYIDTSDDGLATSVTINLNQLRDWLTRQPCPTTPSPRDAAIRTLLSEGLRPPSNIPWKSFCDKVRDEADGWQVRDKPAYGFSLKQIQRTTKIETSRMS